MGQLLPLPLPSTSRSKEQDTSAAPSLRITEHGQLGDASQLLDKHGKEGTCDNTSRLSKRSKRLQQN